MAFVDTIGDMDYIERITRCMIRAGKKPGTFDAAISLNVYRQRMYWILWPCPWLEPPIPGMPAPRALCDVENQDSLDTTETVLAVPLLLDGLGVTLSVSRTTNETDFDYSGRLLAA